MTIMSGMTLLPGGLAAVALLGRPGHGYGWMPAGLLLMGCGIALAMPAMANAIMSSIPPAKAGSGAGVQGTVNEFGGGLGVAILGAVLNSRFAAMLPAGLGAGAAGSLHEALVAARTPQLRSQVHAAFADGVRASQLIGALAVFCGGLVAGLLLRGSASPEAESPATQEAKKETHSVSRRRTLCRRTLTATRSRTADGGDTHEGQTGLTAARQRMAQVAAGPQEPRE